MQSGRLVRFLCRSLLLFKYKRDNCFFVRAMSCRPLFFFFAILHARCTLPSFAVIFFVDVYSNRCKSQIYSKTRPTHACERLALPSRITGASRDKHHAHKHRSCHKSRRLRRRRRGVFLVSLTHASNMRKLGHFRKRCICAVCVVFPFVRYNATTTPERYTIVKSRQLAKSDRPLLLFFGHEQ